MNKVFLFLCLLFPQLLAAQSIDDIYREFAAVPDSTRPKTWWFHGETETTPSGITADLEALRSQGIGGVVYYDQVHGKAENADTAFSAHWWEMLKFAAKEAKRLGLTFEINISNGYVCGGPWITPDLAMRRVCVSETIVPAGKLCTLHSALCTSSKDIATLAFPVSKDYTLPEISDEKEYTLHDNDSLIIPLPTPSGEFTARSLTYAMARRGKAENSSMNKPLGAEGFLRTRSGGRHIAEPGHDNFVEYPPIGSLECSDDSILWREVCAIPNVYQDHGARTQTIAFEGVTAKHFRVRLHDWACDVEAKPTLKLRGLKLSSRPRMNKWETLSGATSGYTYSITQPSCASALALDTAKMLDLTDSVRNGHLRWQAPDTSDWLVLRFAHEPTGGRTKHGRRNLLGLECDKLNPEAVRLHWQRYPQAIIDTLRSVGVKCDGVILDSHEAGPQNWTADFERLFLERRGYSLRPYLAAMAGYVVTSTEETERVLKDVRRTIADGVADRYFATIQKLATEAGVTLTAQAPGNWQNMVTDAIQSHGRVEKPQGEFWAKHEHGSYDIREAVSAAHLYGKRIASAEALTDAKYSQSWSELKALTDYALCYGVNEFVLLATAYQPWASPDSISTGGGRHYGFGRKNTLWQVSRPFWDYLARGAYIMRQGKPVVDLLVNLGDDAPMKQLSSRLPLIPEGYNWDVCSAECRVQSAELCSVQSAECRVQSNSAQPDYVVCIQHSALKGDSALCTLHSALPPDLLWHPKERQMVYSISSAEPERHHRADPKDRLNWAHRRTQDADIYAVSNHSREPLIDTLSLRTPYTAAEYWDMESGRRYALPAWRTLDGRLSVSVALAPEECGIIVARRQALPDLQERIAPASIALKPLKPLKPLKSLKPLKDLNDNWRLTFHSADTTITLKTLQDWTSLPDTTLRHYSGAATYSRTFSLKSASKGQHLVLCFDQVHEVAVVRVNGKEVKTVWCSPWEADITDAVKDGDNLLEITVYNVLTNAMIGDASRSSGKRLFCYPPIVNPDDQLKPSGLTRVEIIKASPPYPSPSGEGSK